MPVKEKIGIVVSNKMDKTVVVRVESRFPSSDLFKNNGKNKKIFSS